MKKIAIFVNDLKVGGIQKSIVNLLNIINSKYEIDLYVFDNDSFYQIPKNINVIYLKRPSSLYKFIPFKIVKKIMKIDVKDTNYDIAIDFDSYQMYTAMGALTCNAKKRVIWIHNDIQIKLKEELKYRILHYFFKKKYIYFDIYCSVSDGALKSFQNLNNFKDKKCVVIPNIIDTKEIEEKIKEKSHLKVNNKIINIVTVGRLCHQKGIDIMLNNIKILLEQRNDFHLYIIGDGPDRKKLEGLSNKLNLGQYVTFLGNQKNPYKYLKKMDVFYLSSRYEGQGMVILEALSVGLDIVIPEHLEKYCPPVKGTDDIIKYFINYKKKTDPKKFNDLQEYNNQILEKIDNIINE